MQAAVNDSDSSSSLEPAGEHLAPAHLAAIAACVWEDAAVVVLRADGTIAGCNETAQRLYGYRAGQIVGQHYAWLYNEGDVALGLAEENLRACAAAEHLSMEMARRRCDGTQVWVAGRLRVVRGAGGGVCGYVEVARDLRAIKEAQAAGIRYQEHAARLEARFTGFLNHIPGRVWIEDARGDYVWSNDELRRSLAARGGLARERNGNDRAGRGFHLLSGYRTVLKRPPARRLEVTLEQGKARQWLVSRFALGEDSGELGAIAIEVTELHHLRDELRYFKHELMRDRRAATATEIGAGFAHDLNVTLNAMKLRLELIAAGGAGAESAAQVRILDRLVNDAAARVRGLLEAVRQGNRRRAGAVNLCKVVSETLELVRPQMAERGRRIVLDNRLPAQLPLVRGRAAELRHLLTNLLLNARDAMPHGGRVAIDARGEGRRVMVRVSDTGMGIPREHLRRLFQPFFTTKGRRGNGLGLAMARAVMRHWGGEIQACNRPEGGAEFILTFIPARRADPPAPLGGRGPGPAPRRVLLVEDDANNREALTLALALKGYQVDAAASGEEALARFAEGDAFDAAVCDVELPAMGGWAVAARILRLRPGLRVIMLTGGSADTGLAANRNLAVAGVLTKPIDLEQLHRAIAGG
jgi:PAS domain S-box-containing protein